MILYFCVHCALTDLVVSAIGTSLNDGQAVFVLR